MSNDIGDDELLDDLKRVARQLDHSPSKREYGQYGEYGVSTLEHRFGCYNAAKEATGLDTTPAPADHGVLDPDHVDDDALDGVLDQ